MRFVKLSHDLDVNSPVHVALRIPEITQNKYVSLGDGYNSFILTFENHSGTHVDAPGHFLEEGKVISDYSLDELIFKNPSILDIPKNMNELIGLQDVIGEDFNGVDCVIFRTGFEKFHDLDTKKYLLENPGISPDVIYWIRKKFPEVRCVGMDCISISSYKYPDLGEKAHINAFKISEELGEPLLLIEDMKLSDIENELLNEVMVIPWQIKGIDSAPCTVIAKITG